MNGQLPAKEEAAMHEDAAATAKAGSAAAADAQIAASKRKRTAS